MPNVPSRAGQLAEHGDHAQHGGEAEHRRLEHRLEVGVDADLGEEHRDEDVADGAEVAGDAVVLVALPEPEAGHEGADDERQLGGVGELGERDRRRQRGDGDRGRRDRPPVDGVEQPRARRRCRPRR